MIRSTAARSQTFRSAIIAVVSLVFALWGAYDYWVRLPNQSTAAYRAQILRSVQSTGQEIMSLDAAVRRGDLTLGSAEFKVQQDATRASIETTSAILRNAIAVADAQLPLAPEDGASVEITAESFLTTMDIVTWRGILGLTQQSLLDPSATAQIKSMGPILVQDGLNAWGDIIPPSKFDRQFQWVYISCIVLVPFYLLAMFRIMGRAYILEDDGTLVTPEGTWPQDEIKEIDMSRWMAKSTAKVDVGGETPILLDAYLYKNLDAIVGAIAHRLHPAKWGEDARPVKVEAPETEGDQD
jgi:hypothetical protein